MIELEKASYKYPGGRWVLRDISLSVKPNEVVVVVGRNGKGKSTLGNILAGLYRPKGEILLDGKKYSKIKNKDLRKKVGVVFQNPDNQVIFACVRDDMEFTLKNLGIINEEWEERITTSLAAVGMEDYIDANPHELSYGQKQRIAIAGMLAVKPNYMIFDEPTAMVDNEGREKICRIIRDLGDSEVGVVFVTNNIDEIRYGDRVVFLDGGKIFREHKKGEGTKIIKTLEELGFGLTFYWQMVAASLKDATIRKLLEEMDE